MYAMTQIRQQWRYDYRAARGHGMPAPESKTYLAAINAVAARKSRIASIMRRALPADRFAAIAIVDARCRAYNNLADRRHCNG